MNTTTDREQPKLLRLASQRPFVIALLGWLLMWLCQPPAGLWPLGWIAAVPLVALVAVPRFQATRPMWWIWLAGLIYWAAATYYIPIPHPALYIAWVMLFCYLSVYPMLFVWLGRKLVHQRHLPLLVAAPAVFVSMEWVRAHMLTGFGFSMLANSQYQQTLLIQICDLAGAYGLSFLMVVFSVGLFYLFCGRRVFGTIASVAVVAAVLVYGSVQVSRFQQLDGKTVDVAVVQGSIDTRFPTTDSEKQAYLKQLQTDYMELQTSWQLEHRQNKKKWPSPDLIIWPEGKYPVPNLLPGGDQRHDRVRADFRAFHRLLFNQIRNDGPLNRPAELPTMIVGASSAKPDSDHVYNSALMIDQTGRISGTYHKMHLVPFGEFTPFADWFPFLARLTPIGSGFQAGKQAQPFFVDSIVAAPCVCFESTVAHLIRESLGFLDRSGTPPDVLVNVTDDGWFYGHCLLDHHLATTVIRAVENRCPVIAASNTGISAFIQSTGKILQRGPRRKSEVLRRNFKLKRATSLYSIIADWPEIVMTTICILALVLPTKKRASETDEQSAKDRYQQEP